MLLLSKLLMPKMSQMGIIPSSVPSFWEQILFPQVLPSLASLFLSGLSSNVESERSWLTIKLCHLLNPTCFPTAHPPSHLCLITLGFFLHSTFHCLTISWWLIYLLSSVSLTRAHTHESRCLLSNEPGYLGTQKLLGKKYSCKKSMSSTDHTVENIPCSLWDPATHRNLDEKDSI